MSQVIDALLIVVVSVATHGFNHEGNILRDVFFYLLSLACWVGLELAMWVYVRPFALRAVP